MNLANAPSANFQPIYPFVRLLDSIHQIQLRFINDAAGSEAFEGLLAIFLDLTDSKYGFTAEVLYRNDRPSLKARALTNIAWNEETLLWARELAQRAPLSLRYAMPAVATAIGNDLDTTFDYEVKLQILCSTSEDQIEGVTAFM